LAKYSLVGRAETTPGFLDFASYHGNKELYLVTDSSPQLERRNFTVESAGGTSIDLFSFSAHSTAAAPDAGSAIALLGIALTGIEGLRRKLRRAT